MTIKKFMELLQRDEINDVDDNASDGKSFVQNKIMANILERPGNEGNANRPPVASLNV